MANKELGFVMVYRSIQNNWIWNNDEPFSKGQAWIDLLLSVNHKEKKIYVGGRVQVIKPGQMWTSYEKLANRWNWSKDRVFRYTKLLKSDGMIQVDATPLGTLLTLVNYDNFNGHSNTYKYTDKDTIKDTIEDTGKDTIESQTIMINKINNADTDNKRKPQISKWGERQ